MSSPLASLQMLERRHERQLDRLPLLVAGLGGREADGFTISFWTYLSPDPDRTPTEADCSAMLEDLHRELRSYSGDLPGRDLATNADRDAVKAHHDPDSTGLSRCTDLRTLQVALCLIGIADVFRDVDGWAGAIRSCVRSLRTAL